MFTKLYKGWYVNCYIAKPNCTVFGFPQYHFKSYRAAQIAITKYENKWSNSGLHLK
jgi:hypothetical protein